MGIESEAGKAEKIGLVGSPSSTLQLRLDIVASAVEKRLVGSIAFLRYRQEDGDAYAIGQIGRVTLRNIFAEDQTMKSLTKQRGEVPSITESQDTHTAEMMISAVFSAENGGIFPTTFGTVPPIGTAIRIINQDIMKLLVERYADQVVHIGRVFGSDVLLPSWFRHFGKPQDGGIGDAMHIGVFGKTGSGKSVLGKMIMLSYMRHEAMSLLVLDPQGEFSTIDGDDAVRKYVGATNKNIRTYDLSKLILLPDEDLFKKILVDSQFLKRLGIRMGDNQKDAADQVVRILHSTAQTLDDTMGKIGLDRIHERGAFDRVLLKLQDKKYLGHIYTYNQAQYNRVLDELKDADPDELYAKWQKVARLFGREGNTHRISDLLDGIGGRGGGVTIINLSEASAPKDIFWSDGVQKAVINHILNELVDIAQSKFNEGGNLNTLVVLDEAHRLAPRTGTYGDEDATALRGTLLDAVRTTRKFGLGWMFISQTLASLDRELLLQLHMYFFGYGLAWGTELKALKELIGGNDSVLDLYQQFHDPESGLGNKKYSFMGVGPSSPLAFSGVPLFFNSLQFPDEFVANNSTGENAA